MMDLWSSALVSLFLLACSAGLMVWHVRSWRAAQAEQTEAAELDYRRRQFRRRVQSTAMLAILAVAISVGQVLTTWIVSRPFAILFWLGVLLLLGWMGLLAVADIIATKFHYERISREYRIEQAKLQAELRRIQASRRNGEPPGRGGRTRGEGGKGKGEGGM
jgi:hypothetical protein